jgi:SnoaL-like domain
MLLRKSILVLALAVAPIGAQAFAQPRKGEQARLLDRVAIEDLLASYLYRLDHAEVDKLPELFTADGVMDTENAGPLKGPQEIAAFYAKRSKTRTTRHVMTNLYIKFDDADHAHTVHTLTYYMGEGAGPFPATPSGVADYANTVVRGKDGQWRIQYRKPTPIFGFRPAAPVK